ncbi:MAG: methyltransferase, partial [Mariprofundaceae bacterium]|nr:methyltransferase [Mariprofundaceae bacterium]
CAYHYVDATVDALPSALDWVLCNPPFHTGQTREVSLGQAIVAQGCQSLKRGGHLWMVANRQLPYEHVLTQQLEEHHIIIEANGFKIIHGVR